MTNFNIGDEVYIIDSFPESDALHFAIEMRELVNDGRIRKVTNIFHLNDGDTAYTLNGNWTWRSSSLQHVIDPAVPYSKIIRKIKAMENKRKDQGYAF